MKGQQLHYVGALTPYHHKQLRKDAMEDFHELEVDGKNIQVYRDKRIIWQEERTVIVFISERLKTGQIRGYINPWKIQKNISVVAGGSV